MDKHTKRVFQRIGSYLIVYFVFVISVDVGIYTFERMVLLALAYIVVDVSIMKAELVDKKK